MATTFEQWMNEVNACLESEIGLSTMDLPDRCYRDFYDDEMEPSEVASDIVWDMENGGLD